MEDSKPTSSVPNAQLHEIMSDELNETFWCDLEFIKTLRLISKNLEIKDLKKECDDHAWQIEEQIVRLKKASTLVGIDLKAKSNHIMAALLHDSVVPLGLYQHTEALDTVVITALRKACRFRRAMYQTLITYFGLMEFEEAEIIIAKTYKEEDRADDRLLSLAYKKLLPLQRPASSINLED